MGTMNSMNRQGPFSHYEKYGNLQTAMINTECMYQLPVTRSKQLWCKQGVIGYWYVAGLSTWSVTNYWVVAIVRASTANHAQDRARVVQSLQLIGLYSRPFFFFFSPPNANPGTFLGKNRGGGGVAPYSKSGSLNSPLASRQ